MFPSHRLRFVSVMFLFCCYCSRHVQYIYAPYAFRMVLHSMLKRNISFYYKCGDCYNFCSSIWHNFLWACMRRHTLSLLFLSLHKRKKLRFAFRAVYVRGRCGMTVHRVQTISTGSFAMQSSELHFDRIVISFSFSLSLLLAFVRVFLNW